MGKLVDPECRALWNVKLKYSPISHIKKMWGFKNTHWGAITLELEGNMTVLFKVSTWIVNSMMLLIWLVAMYYYG